MSYHKRLHGTGIGQRFLFFGTNQTPPQGYAVTSLRLNGLKSDTDDTVCFVCLIYLVFSLY